MFLHFMLRKKIKAIGRPTPSASWPLPHPGLTSFVWGGGNSGFCECPISSCPHTTRSPFSFHLWFFLYCLCSPHTQRMLKSLPFKAKQNCSFCISGSLSCSFFPLPPASGKSSLPSPTPRFPCSSLLAIRPFYQHLTANTPTEVTGEAHVQIIGWFSARI